MAAGGDGTAAASATKKSRNTTAKTGTGLLDVLSEATRDARETGRVAKVQKFVGTVEKQGKQVPLLDCIGEEKAQFTATMIPEKNLGEKGKTRNSA
jgi:hypothetical protein